MKQCCFDRRDITREVCAGQGLFWIKGNLVGRGTLGIQGCLFGGIRESLGYRGSCWGVAPRGGLLG